MYKGSNYNHSHHPHHHYPSHYQKGGAATGLPPISPETAQATEIFEHFIVATTFKSVLHHYKLLCDVLRIRPTNIRNFYPKLKSKIRSWKAQAIWTKFDKRISHKCYNHGKACSDTKALIIGCGPCGLRAAIEAQLLGAKVVVVEKRDRFSRNNVLHLWPFVIADLKALGAKKFYGKFCAGAIDHISIRQLQCILLKVALLLGVEVFEAVTFEELLDPPEDQSQRIGWHARFSPMEHPVNQYEFDVLISADGKRNTLMGFKRKEFRGKLAIAITANFINRRSEQEARVQEISGVAFIFNQKFFKDLYAATGIDLENIVYYKDETHYFVMTAKKHSLIDKGVILRDLPDTQQLLHPNNVDRQALCDYAREAADFSTGYLMPHSEFAVNHYGKPDIAMFDFTSMFAAENACRVVEKNGHKLLKCLVGDSLLEPFWPTGSGCARGFLSSFDACWATRSWALNKANPLEVIAERESIYRLLAQTTPENLSKDYSSYTLEPSSRYPTVNLKVLLPFQVRHLFTTDEPDSVDVKVDDQLNLHKTTSEEELPRKRKRKNSVLQPETLLSWCQKQVMQHPEIEVENLSSSFKDGRVLCAIISRYRPDLIDFDSLDPENEADNNQLALDILEKEFGILPVSTGEELSSDGVAKPCLMPFISQIHDSFRGEIPQFMGSKPPHKSLKGQNMDHLDLDDFPTQSKNLLETESSYTGSSASSQSATSKIACRIFEEPKLNVASKETLQQIKKRRSDVDSMGANAYQRHEEIHRNREERVRKQKKQRELNAVRFIRSMRMLHCDVRSTSLHSSTTPSFRQSEDSGLLEYRKQCVKSMREKAADLERKIYFPDKLEYDNFENIQKPGLGSTTEKFTDKVRGLEAKFKGDTVHTSQQKPKDMIRAVGRLEKTDWNLCAIERKIEDNPKSHINKNDKERVPKWSKDMYNDKFQNIERRLRENGEDEERIAKYLDIDASLQRLERKLREGSTLETGLRGHNKVSNLASQLSSKLVHQPEDKVVIPKQARSMILPSSTSDLCYFCGTRVYLVERLSAEGKYFHRQCFKCNYCGALLRLGNYIYDRENRFGGKFFCVPHFGLTVRSRVTKKPEETLNIKDRTTSGQSESYYSRTSSGVPSREKASAKGESNDRTTSLISPQLAKIVSPLTDRGGTPERVEFENSVIEHSDEEEYLSEEEWTDRNFGASANELDDDDDDDDSDYSDLSDEEVGEEILDSPHQLTADETRRLAESWKRRYSNDVLEGSDHESLSDSELDDLSEEHGADGDESHTATEGDICEDGEEEDIENDKEKRERELRRLEFNINIEAPPKAETSDSGSETEVASEEDSDTEIDTDSEFDEDNMQSQKPKEIPTIVINELTAEEGRNNIENGELLLNDQLTSEKEFKNKTNEKLQEVPIKESMSQSTDLVQTVEGAERSTSLINLPQNQQPNPRTEQLKRLLHRTESTEAVSAYKSSLRRQYLLGNSSSIPKKSVSSTDLGDRFKSFMDKISETQKKLNPAPEPSPAMQAFLNSSSISSLSSSSSPSRSTTFISEKYVPAISLIDSPPVLNGNVPLIFNLKNGCRIRSSTEESSDTSKSEEGKIFSFPETDEVSNLSRPMPVELPSALDSYKVPSENYLRKLPLKEGNTNNNVSVTIDELSFPVHLEEETDNIVCIDAKNVCMIESLSPNTSKNNLGNIQETLFANEAFRDSTLILSEKLIFPATSAKIMETLSCEIISHNNNKNTSNDSILLEDIDTLTNCSDIDIDECFDKLANDAMLEIDQFEVAPVPSAIDNLTVASFKSQKFIDEPINPNTLVYEDALKSNNVLKSELLKSVEKLITTPEQFKVKDSQKSDFSEDCDHINSVAVKGNEGLISNGEHVKDNDSLIYEKDLALKNISESTANHEHLKGKYSLMMESLEASNIITSASLKSNNVDKNCNFRNNTSMEIVDHKIEETPCFVSKEEDDKAKQYKNEEYYVPSIELNLYELEKDSEEILSPQTVGLTEFDLSDWAEDIEATSFGVEELRNDTPCNDSKKESVSVSKNLHMSKIRARIASLESLEDSDSALSNHACKNVAVQSPILSKPSVLKEIEQNLDYMDTSRSDSSLEDNTNPIPFSYKKLQDETPVTTPVLDAPKRIGEPVFDNHSPTTPNMICKEEKSFGNLKSKSLDADEIIGDSILRSASEPLVLKERSYGEENVPKQITPKRYEGYIPRFKDRVMPFSLVRDSIDIRKCSTTKPLFTPSKEDILQRQKNEKFQDNTSQSFDSTGSSLTSPSFNYSNSTPLVSSFGNSTSISSTNSSSVSSPVTSSSKAYGNLSSTESSVSGNKSIGRKPKDGDVVKEMVMSRISKRSSDKANRKGIKNVLHLSFHSSNSSLFGSEPFLSKGILTPSSADAGNSNKENEFSFKSDAGEIESKEPLNISTVPSLNNRSLVDFSEKTSAKFFNNDADTVRLSPRNILPATPLTHPEKFQRSSQLKKELFKSTPHLPSSSSYRLPVHLPASPPPLSGGSLYFSNDNLITDLTKTTSSNEDSQAANCFRAQSESPLPKVNCRSEKESSIEHFYGSANYNFRERPTLLDKMKKNPDERLKELLAERKRKDFEDQRDVRLRNKDSCLQECLEEYRQKRNSAPIPQEFSIVNDTMFIDNPKSHIDGKISRTKRHFHRPSLLELESMQVFSTANQSLLENDCSGHTSKSPSDQQWQESSPCTNLSLMLTNIAGTSNFITQSPNVNVSHVELCSDAPTAVSTSEIPKKSTKKSKDRERRRSLIQVFAGMFAKTDDKKKSPEENDPKPISSNSSLNIPHSPVAPVSVTAPKSPSVKERFSKLRLSRSKDKKKLKIDNKNRSASADIPIGGDDDNLHSSLSLPTSPSRTIFSFLSSPSPTTHIDRTKPSNSGPSSNNAGQLYHSSCIQEENCSEDEMSLHNLTMGATSNKDTLPSLATPSTRRQKAALRAAKQAEQKRLRMAQEIQRHLEECEVMTRELEERGIKIEKALMGETNGTCRDEPHLMKEWFGLVREKNKLIRWQEELMIKAKKLELEDRHVRLESELRQRMTCSESEKTRDDIDREGRVLAEIISVIEEKDALASQLEEERKRYKEEDKELEAFEARKILQQHSFQKETGV